MDSSEALDYFTHGGERIALNAGGEASWWWLRSPGYNRYIAPSVGVDSEFAKYVRSSGHIDDFGYEVDYDDGGVRPACG